MSKLNRLGKLILATIKGDNAEALQIKIVNKGISAFESQIAVKKAKTLDLKEAIEEAEANVDLALINKGATISDREQYLKNYMLAVKELEDAEEALEDHLQTIAILEEGLNNLQAEE